MKEKSFKKYLASQVKAIDRSKWFKGEKIGQDPGDEFIVDWVNEHGPGYREAWIASACSRCRKDCDCDLKAFCEEFDMDKELLDGTEP